MHHHHLPIKHSLMPDIRQLHVLRKVRAHVEAGMSGLGGVIRQAFCGFLDQELRDYYRLMAILEAQTRQLLPVTAKGWFASAWDGFVPFQ